MKTSAEELRSNEALRLAATATMGIDSGHGVARIVLKPGLAADRPAHGYVHHEEPLLRKTDVEGHLSSRESVVRSLRVMIAGEAGVEALADARPDPESLDRSTQFARAWCGNDAEGDELVREVWGPALDWLVSHRTACLAVAHEVAERMDLSGIEVRRVYSQHK
jgi:hypothetical protein